MRSRSDKPATPSGHAYDCDWHVDQNPRECTCGLITLTKQHFPNAELISLTPEQDAA